MTKMTKLEVLRTDVVSSVFRGLIPLSKKYQQNLGKEDATLLIGSLFNAIEGAIERTLSFMEIPKEDKDYLVELFMEALLTPDTLDGERIELLKDAEYIKKIEFYEEL